MYAMKALEKETVAEQRSFSRVMNERNLLKDLDFPYVVNIRFCFQTEHTLYMVVDLMLGGDVRFQLQDHGSFSEDVARFWAAELVLALEHFASRNVVHRDLKPENMLLDEKGHIHITDFDIAHRGDEVLTRKCGTFGYMSPEVLQGTGYTRATDLWSLGIVLYEIVYGKRPFRGSSEAAVRASILENDVFFGNSISEEGKSFISQLLAKDPQQRLGVGPKGFKDIKAHPWFKNTNWKAVLRKEVEAPYKPESGRANCSAVYELEEQIIESGKKRRSLTVQEQCAFEEFDLNTRVVAPIEARRRSTSIITSHGSNESISLESSGTPRSKGAVAPHTAETADRRANRMDSKEALRPLPTATAESAAPLGSVREEEDFVAVAPTAAPAAVEPPRGAGGERSGAPPGEAAAGADGTAAGEGDGEAADKRAEAGQDDQGGNGVESAEDAGDAAGAEDAEDAAGAEDAEGEGAEGEGGADGAEDTEGEGAEGEGGADGAEDAEGAKAPEAPPFENPEEVPETMDAESRAHGDEH